MLIPRDEYDRYIHSTCTRINEGHHSGMALFFWWGIDTVGVGATMGQIVTGRQRWELVDHVEIPRWTAKRVFCFFRGRGPNRYEERGLEHGRWDQCRLLE